MGENGSVNATPVSDAVALDTIRAFLLEAVEPDTVGDYLGSVGEGALGVETVTTYRFASILKGYRGWMWAVTAINLPGEAPTIAEVVLLPGEEAVLAPTWVPWRERIMPGDLSPGDILPVEEDDPRLVPGYFVGEDHQPPLDRQSARALADEVGLGRARVLSKVGRDQAAQRWYDGTSGPTAAIAKSAPGRCNSCGFLVRLAGPMSTMFGVCANGFANDDAHVVSFDHGCGAHSQAQLRRKRLLPVTVDPAFDVISRGDIERF